MSVRCEATDSGRRCLLVKGHLVRHCAAGVRGWHYFGEDAEFPEEPPPEPPKLDAEALEGLARCVAEPGALEVSFGKECPSGAVLGLLAYGHDLVRLARLGLAADRASESRDVNDHVIAAGSPPALACVCGQPWSSEHVIGPACIRWAHDAEATPERVPPGYAKHIDDDGAWRAVKVPVTTAIADGTSQPWTPDDRAALRAEKDHAQREAGRYAMLAQENDRRANVAEEQRNEARRERDEAREAAAHDEATLRASKRASDERENDLRLRLEGQRLKAERLERERAAEYTARVGLGPAVTALHQVAQVLGLPIGADLHDPVSGVVAKVKDALAFACGRELVRERDAMRDRMVEAQRQLENEKQARLDASERARRAEASLDLSCRNAGHGIAKAIRDARSAEGSARLARLALHMLQTEREVRLVTPRSEAFPPTDEQTEAERLAGLLEHTRQNMTLVRATADRDRERADGLEWTLSELRRSARAAFDGWRLGDDVGGPMFALDAMLKQIDAHEPPCLLPTPVETYRRALCFWGLVLGYEPGRQLNAMVYHVLGDARASLPPTLCHLASGGYPRLDGHPIGGPYRWSVPSIQRMIDAALAAVGVTAKGSDGAEGSKGS